METEVKNFESSLWPSHSIVETKVFLKGFSNVGSCFRLRAKESICVSTNR